MSVNNRAHAYIYPLRYSKNAFDQAHDILQNAETQSDYIKWTSGINYKTNRKITIGGTRHQQLAEKFMIQDPFEYIQGQCLNKGSVLFVRLVDIDVNGYLQKTDKIKSVIEKLNSKTVSISSSTH